METPILSHIPAFPMPWLRPAHACRYIAQTAPCGAHRQSQNEREHVDLWRSGSSMGMHFPQKKRATLLPCSMEQVTGTSTVAFFWGFTKSAITDPLDSRTSSVVCGRARTRWSHPRPGLTPTATDDLLVEPPSPWGFRFSHWSWRDKKE